MTAPANLPRPALTHLGFYVTNMALMVEFYTSQLGMVVTDRGEAAGAAWTFLSGDPREHHQVVLATGRPPGSFQLINQVSFRLPDLEGLRTYHRHLSSIDATGLEAVTHGNSWSVYFRDPEGNRIELYCSSPWYVSQPMRVPVDLTQSADDLLAQTDALTRDDPSRVPLEDWSRGVDERLGRSGQAPTSVNSET